ncbi:hypothetical protein FHR32_002221 [Streptosporangium album]|uniref:Excreted virulence factor EspC, type VII ESX diderm n=1 Tax=Streptosporangium album TaxID=47479 RepID=A0A7W7RV17_9ACTN|nr:hypothetical protein [Streptosporangium album]
MREVNISHSELSETASALARLSGELVRDVETFRMGLAEDGDPLGDGELTGELGEFHRRLVQMLVDKGQGIADQYGTVSERLWTMSVNHRGGERVSEEAIEKITHPDVRDV